MKKEWVLYWCLKKETDAASKIMEPVFLKNNLFALYPLVYTTNLNLKYEVDPSMWVCQAVK